MLVVVVRSKLANGQETSTFEYDQPVITIGRAEVNDIVLPTPKVSKRHARLEVTPHGLVLTDLKSTNGTYLNGRKVMAAVLVGEGDHVHVGEFSIEVKSATGIPSKPMGKSGQPGFTALAQASADTEPNDQNQTSNEEPPTRRGAAYRMSWLDDWAAPSSQRSAGSASSNPSRNSSRTGTLLEGHRRESSMTFVLQASMPGLISVGQHVSLRVWADARMNAKEAQSGRLRLSAALEISLSLPDGKIEAPHCDHGMLQVVNGGQSAEMVISLRGRDVGPARIELAVCHRGARIATLTLRPEIRAMTLVELGELSPHSEIQVSTPLESVLPACGPHVILRLREFGPLLAPSENGGPVGPSLAETQPSISGSHNQENARRRRLKVDLCLLHEETSEIVASGEVPLEVPLSDRLRTFMASQEVERVGTVVDSARESALQAVGESLASMLLPTSVREALGALAPGSWLMIDSAETWVPWELVRVSRGLTSHYLGERFALSRSGSGSYVARFATMPCVLVTPPGGEAMVRREQQALASLDVRLRQVNRLMDALPLLSQPGMAAWHITGHGGFDRADRSGASLRLEEGVLSPVQVMPAARFRKSGQTPPFQGSFIFIAVSEPTAPQAPLAPAGTSQWIERFLAAGAGAVVATTFPLSSAKCAQFAETFYRAWSSNRPLAIAAAEAREAIRADGDPAWLAFAVYGLPGARLGSL